VVEIGGGYQLATKPEYYEFVQRLVESSRKQKLSKAAMETLAVIAYKQPVVRSTIESIRGVNVDGVLRTLMERDLVRIVGREDGPGRPLLFGTTREFLMRFGLNKVSDLPGLKEIEELVGAEEGVGSGEQAEGSAGVKEEGVAADEESHPGEAGPESEDITGPAGQDGVTEDAEEGKTQ
jgi:segregation and condensation protein B